MIPYGAIVAFRYGCFFTAPFLPSPPPLSAPALCFLNLALAPVFCASFFAACLSEGKVIVSEECPYKESDKSNCCNACQYE